MSDPFVVPPLTVASLAGAALLEGAAAITLDARAADEAQKRVPPIDDWRKRCGVEWRVSPSSGALVDEDAPGIGHVCGLPVGHDGDHVCLSVQACGSTLRGGR